MPDQRSAPQLQAINPPGLYDPAPNGYSNLMITPANARCCSLPERAAKTQTAYCPPSLPTS